MTKAEYHVIGVMSGTSLDGVDLAYIRFDFNGNCSFEIINAITISYSNSWRKTLGNLIDKSLEELHGIDSSYTDYLAEVISSFIKSNKIKVLDAICSHGHTALHQPEHKLTYQIGNMPKLADLLNKTIVCDFRVQDVDLGGQGAPLVPIGDDLLFSEFDYCLNLGGFANVSTEIDSKRIAFDICPVNIILNHYVNQHGLAYDDEGKIASTGNLNSELLQKLNELEFYQKPHPKSLGLEWVKTEIFPLIDSYNLETPDVLKTCIEHIAVQISSEINKKSDVTVLVAGGGVFNSFLIDRIRSLSVNDIVIPSKQVIEFKEALIFGLLGVLKLRNEVNCLSSVTGASMNHSSGKIYHP
ncbi:anhydro-N-acetylmuramic acid kinase [Changchengzhania lutea]|uniref:anhydro-N-acetylmuramic acid kinase n=1 Tax=Changchengzhania lutea TaxID=2049305 RepID=UPI00115D37B5|nr:anhydro-N-acetylmuramic acid kinase [Changchengzhania lutea]